MTVSQKPLFVIKNAAKTKLVGLDGTATVALETPEKIKPIFYDSKFSAKHAAKLMDFEEELVVEISTDLP